VISQLHTKLLSPLLSLYANGEILRENFDFEHFTNSRTPFKVVWLEHFLQLHFFLSLILLSSLPSRLLYHESVRLPPRREASALGARLRVAGHLAHLNQAAVDAADVIARWDNAFLSLAKNLGCNLPKLSTFLTRHLDQDQG
jgi:hypothetical protein